MRIKYTSITICIIASLFIVLKMYTGNNIFLGIFLLLIFLGILFEKAEYRIEYLLFFISWIYVIKFDFAQISLFVFLSMFYLILSSIDLWCGNRKISFDLFLRFCIFSSYIVIIPLLHGGEVTEIFGFLLNFSVIFFAIIFVNKETHLKRYILMYSFGVLTSACVRLMSFSIPNINSYIENMTSVNTVYVSGALSTRFAGLDLDPNYFALQTLFGVSCLCVCLFYKGKIDKKILFLLIALMGFGFLSFSKMYIISLLFLIIITLFVFFKNNIRIAVKFSLIIAVIITIGFYFFYDYLSVIYLARFFGEGTTLDAITTGRTETWSLFLKEIAGDFWVFFFGEGVGTELLSGTIAHNMYLTMFYYMGILGFCITIIYFIGLFIGLQQNLGLLGKFNIKIWSVNSIPLYIVLLMNMGLDSFVMDFFPFHIFLLFVSLSINKANLG